MNDPWPRYSLYQHDKDWKVADNIDNVFRGASKEERKRVAKQVVTVLEVL